MSREKLLHVPVENKSDDVLCPECNEKMRKTEHPNFPTSDPPKSDDMSGIHGLVGCDNADCPVHDGEQKLVSWSYRTSEVAHREIVNPAKEGEPFRHGPAR